MKSYERERAEEVIEKVLREFEQDLDDYNSGNGDGLPYTKEETEYAIDILRKIKEQGSDWTRKYLKEDYASQPSSKNGWVEIATMVYTHPHKQGEVFQWDWREPNEVPSRRKLIKDLKKVQSAGALEKVGHYWMGMLAMLITKYKIEYDEWHVGAGEGLWYDFQPKFTKQELLELIKKHKTINAAAKATHTSPSRFVIEMIYRDIEVNKYKRRYPK